MSKPLASSKLSNSFQLSIPKDVRKLLNADAGDLILFFERDGEIILRASVGLPERKE